MLLDSLFSRRVVVLTGKGGVGKSVVGAALALAARERGKRVLLVEVAAPVEAGRLLGGTPSMGRETEAVPGLFTLNLDPATVMDEYVRHVVKLEMFVRRILGSPIYRRFFAAAPGLKELMVLGKVMVLEEARARFSHAPLWDLIVLDAPATGHGLAFLKVPLAASAAVPVGTIGHNARRVLGLLRDPARTALVLVAIPEEMAVVEAVQFHRMAREEIGLSPSLVEILGLVDDLPTLSDMVAVTPVVGLLSTLPPLAPQTGEVARIFTIPFADLMAPGRWVMKMEEHRGRLRRVFYFEHDGELLWGLSARITLNLLGLTPGGPPIPLSRPG